MCAPVWAWVTWPRNHRYSGALRSLRTLSRFLRPAPTSIGRSTTTQCDELLHEFGIRHLRDNMAISLSGGERRRLEIARALAAQPRFILLDEPFAGIDPISVVDIQRIVAQLAERGIGILITDHNVRETLGICNRSYIINDGSVLALGSPDEILANPEVRSVYLGEHFRL